VVEIAGAIAAQRLLVVSAVRHRRHVPCDERRLARGDREPERPDAAAILLGGRPDR